MKDKVWKQKIQDAQKELKDEIRKGFYMLIDEAEYQNLELEGREKEIGDGIIDVLKELEEDVIQKIAKTFKKHFGGLVG